MISAAESAGRHRWYPMSIEMGMWECNRTKFLYAPSEMDLVKCQNWHIGPEMQTGNWDRASMVWTRRMRTKTSWALPAPRRMWNCNRWKFPWLGRSLIRRRWFRTERWVWLLFAPLRSVLEDWLENIWTASEFPFLGVFPRFSQGFVKK